MFPYTCVVLDAVSVINLYASRHFAEILASLPYKIAVAEYVKTEEALWVYNDPANKTKANITPIDLDSHAAAGLLEIVDCELEEEHETLVNFSASRKMHQGEAISAAIAYNRGWAIASEDGPACDWLRSEVPTLNIITTFDIVNLWIAHARPSENLILEVLQNIWLLGGHKPPDTHLLAAVFKHSLANI